MASGFLDDIFKSLMSVVEKVEKVNQKIEESPEILTAEKLRQLRWMNPSALAAIYKYGAKKVTIADTADAYSQLRWFTKPQLEAIFGKGGMQS